MWLWRKFWNMKQEMWEHWCPVEHLIMLVGKGEECNWCGQDETYEERNRRYRDRLTKSDKDPLHNSKRH